MEGSLERLGVEAIDLYQIHWRVAARHDTTPGAVAVAWNLRNPAVDGAIAGSLRPDQVDPIVVAANLELDEDDIDIAAIEGRK